MMKKYTPTTQGVILAARFSLPAYQNDSCGNDEGREQGLKQIHEFLTTKSSESQEAVVEILSTFKTLIPYLNAIKKYTGEETFHIRNVQIYCLGVDSIENNFFGSEISHYTFPWVLSELKDQKMHPKAIENLKHSAPDPFMPFHSYHVFLDGFVNYGKDNFLKGITNCMVNHGVVKEVKDDGKKLVVRTFRLVLQSGSLFLLGTESEVEFNKEYFVDSLKTYDKVAIHQGHVFKLLADVDYSRLMARNQQVVDIFKRFR